MSFDLMAHIAHEDSLLEGAGDVPEATVLPDPLGDAKFFGAWRVYRGIAVSRFLTSNRFDLISFTGGIHRKCGHGTRSGPHAQCRRSHGGTMGPRVE
jgi:hypothetical protein